MENQQPKTGKFAMTYGLILAGISIAFSLMLFFLDMHYQGGFAILAVSLVITLGVIIFALSQFKKANGGYMSFGQALKIGVGLSLIGGFIAIMFQLLLTNVIDPDFATKAETFQRESLKEYGLTAEQIDSQIEMGQKFQKPYLQIPFGLIYSVFVGFILTLIPGLIMKKAKPDY